MPTYALNTAYRLGFDDPSYFVKYFKKHTKISPSEFRRSIS
ncbi:AraC family transcriptional regulator [Chitinophaga sp. GbtcB8]|nr:helix-turn-helix domain-containing protein [Chitinophaga sp. GbtcB8]